MSQAVERIMRGLEAVGKLYRNEILALEAWDTEKLRKDWFYAMTFVLSRLYLQGRLDSVSIAFFQAMEGCLRGFFGPDSGTALELLCQNHPIPRDPNWKEIDLSANPLWQKFDQTMGKRRDWEMVVHVLAYAFSIEDHNIVNHSLEKIRKGHLRPHREALRRIRQVDVKTSALYLRDLICLFQLRIEPTDWVAIQAVDTWVQKLFSSLQRYEAAVTSRPAEEWLAANIPLDCDPALVNAGSWYVTQRGAYILLALLANDTISASDLEDMSTEGPGG